MNLKCALKKGDKHLSLTRNKSKSTFPLRISTPAPLNHRKLLKKIVKIVETRRKIVINLLKE